DKIINRAQELKRDPIEHAAIFVNECEKDMESLGMLPPTHTPKVSETMPEIIKMIEDIINNDKAYVV
ncbi:cysteine--tRNA ligase, partial [Enterobacter sp. EC-NT1]